jgi:hypothetical protein
MSTYLNIEDDMNTRGGFGEQQIVAPVPEKPTGPRHPRTVLVVNALFKYGMDKCRQDVIRINKAFGKVKRRPVLHGDRHCGWVLETHFTAEQIMGLLREALMADCIENAWVWTPGADVTSVMPLDPFTDRVREAWQSVREWNRTVPKRPPETFFATSRRIEGGTVATRILDEHPLRAVVERRRA